jgi:hypothetical protein
MASYADWVGKISVLMDWRRTGPGDGDWKWRCGDGRDRFALSRRAAAELGLNFDDMLAIARQAHHICCDCEIVFNDELRREA